MKIVERDIVGVGLISKDNKLLLVKADPKNKGAYEGFWLVHGGGIEAGETKEQAVIRETLEEIGVDVSKYPIKFIADHRSGESEKTLKTSGERVIVKMKFFEYAVYISDKNADEIEVKLSREHSEYKWCSKGELDNLKLNIPSRAFSRDLGF